MPTTLSFLIRHTSYPCTRVSHHSRIAIRQALQGGSVRDPGATSGQATFSSPASPPPSFGHAGPTVTCGVRAVLTTHVMLAVRRTVIVNGRVPAHSG